MTDIRRRRIRLEGLGLFCLEAGEGGRAMLLLHGRWGRAETWRELMLRYAGRYRIVAPDQRGHGLSDRPRSSYTAEELAGDAAALADALGLRELVAIGHSMGAQVAAQLAVARPDLVRGLALLDKSPEGSPPRPPLPPDEIRVDDPVTAALRPPFDSWTAAREAISAWAESETAIRYFMNGLREDDEGVRPLFDPYAIAAGLANNSSWWELLPRIACPTMVARARGGEAVSDEAFHRMAREIPAARAYELSLPDHNLHQADPTEFYRCFDDFLAWLGD